MFVTPASSEISPDSRETRRLQRTGCPMPLGFERAALRPCPGGTSENSPAFQRWVRGLCGISPVGTAEKRLVRPSLRDLRASDDNPSVETLGYFHPSLRDEELQIPVSLD